MARNEQDPFVELDGILKRIFDGPNSLINRAMKRYKQPKKPTIRITLNQKLIDSLLDGNTEHYRTRDFNIDIVSPAKYTREHCDMLLKNKFISNVEYEIMLRQRA